MTTARRRAARASIDKFALRRTMLAEAALATIAERGFARTGLREIAQHSSLSHGSLHYYFTDKDDLIAEAVRISKSLSSQRYDSIMETATTAQELAERIAGEMARTLREDAPIHRLWYDLRTQAMFESGFGDTIQELDDMLRDGVWEVWERHADLAGGRCTFERSFLYALADGMFQNALIHLLRGDDGAPDRLRRECVALFSASV